MEQENFDRALAALNGALADLLVSQDRLAEEFDAAARVASGLLEEFDRALDHRDARQGAPDRRLPEAA